jgi:predicted dehydrogenase
MSASIPPTHVRVGLIGAGFMAQAHTLAYRTVPLFWPGAPTIELVRVVDLDRERAAHAAETYGWQDAGTDIASVTDAEDVDLVDVVTPNDAHEEPICRAARHGKVVLCEKPLAHSAAAARAIGRAVADAGVLGMTSFVYRQWPTVVYARQLIEEGRIGAPRRLSAWFLHDYAAAATEPISWRLRRVSAGAGSLGDLGAHVVDLLQHLGGPIVRVLADAATYVERRPVARGAAATADVDVDDAADVLVEFASGARGHLQTGWAAHGYKTEWGFEVQGDRGTLRFSWQRPNVLELYRADDDPDGFAAIAVGPRQLPGEAMWPVAGMGNGWGDAFVLTAARLLRRLGGEPTTFPTIADGVSAAEVVAAAVSSVERHAWTVVERA